MKQTLLKDIELDIEQLKCLVNAIDSSYNPVLFEAVKRSIIQMQSRLDLLSLELDRINDGNLLVRDEDSTSEDEEKEFDRELIIERPVESFQHSVCQKENIDDVVLDKKSESYLIGEESVCQEQVSQGIEKEVKKEDVEIAIEVEIEKEISQEEIREDSIEVVVEEKNEKELAENLAEMIGEEDRVEEELKIALEVAVTAESISEESDEEFEDYDDEEEEDNYDDEEEDDEDEDEDQLVPITDETLHKIAEERIMPQLDEQVISKSKYIPVSDVLRVDIRQFITLNDTFRFTRELFEGDSEKMKATIAHLDSLNSFEEAVIYMETLMPLEEENEAVQDFIDIIRKRFNR